MNLSIFGNRTIQFMKKFLLFSSLIICCAAIRSQVTFTDSNLPIMVVNTLGGTIVDEPKIKAELGVIDNGPGQRNHLTDPHNGYDGFIGIEIRGSSSQSFPKKGYGLETRDAAGEDLDVALLGLPEESDWVLHGPYSDKSLIRNALAYILAGEIMEYAPRVKMVELVINDEYQGVYLFTEKIKRDKNRIDINKLDPDENEGDDLTGGYILKLDKTTGDPPGFPLFFVSNYPANTPNMQEIWFLYEYPDPEDITNQQRAYVQGSINDFEDALHGEDYLDPQHGYKKYIDLQTFVDFLIINEITKNVDGYRLSTFFYKDKDSKNPRWKMGPVWDFNLGFGNADYCEGGVTSGWAYDFNEYCPDDFWVINFWWERMLTDPAFRLALRNRWLSIRQGQFSNVAIMQKIDSLTTMLGESQFRNFQRWDILSEWVWPNNFVGNNYPAEVQYLKNWTTARLAWLDQAIDELTPVSTPAPGADWQIYPNPAGAFAEILLNSPGSAPVSVEVFDNMGRKVRSMPWPGQEMRCRISTEGLANGLWTVSVRGGDGRVGSRRIAVVR